MFLAMGTALASVSLFAASRPAHRTWPAQAKRYDPDNKVDDVGV